jgi:hypothetical protein
VAKKAGSQPRVFLTINHHTVAKTPDSSEAWVVLSTTSKGMSSVQAAKHVGVCQKPTWFMAHRIREWAASKASVRQSSLAEKKVGALKSQTQSPPKKS